MLSWLNFIPYNSASKTTGKCLQNISIFRTQNYSREFLIELSYTHNTSILKEVNTAVLEKVRHLLKIH